MQQERVALRLATERHIVCNQVQKRVSGKEPQFCRSSHSS